MNRAIAAMLIAVTSCMLLVVGCDSKALMSDSEKIIGKWGSDQGKGTFVFWEDKTASITGTFLSNLVSPTIHYMLSDGRLRIKMELLWSSQEYDCKYKFSGSDTLILSSCNLNGENVSSNNEAILSRIN